METIWQSVLTSEFVSGLDPDNLPYLIRDLEKSVEAVCREWGLL